MYWSGSTTADRALQQWNAAFGQEDQSLAIHGKTRAKARKAIAVPLNAEAVVIIRRQVGKHATHVFSFRGKPIIQVSTKAWYDALQKAGIEDFRWHDLRHTWASWHVQQGTPLHACRNWADGKARRWCGGTRISRLNIWPRTRIASALCG